jgi:hypothetical protein
MEPAEYRRTSYEAGLGMAPGRERWREQLAQDLSPMRRAAALDHFSLRGRGRSNADWSFGA